MPSTYAGNPANYPTNVRAPVNADVGDTTWIGALASDVADRTAALRAGQIQRVASLAALVAMTAHNDGDMCLVTDVGLYHYDAGTSLSVLSPLILKPADVVGAGRWISSAYGLVNVANGAAQLQSDGRLVASLSHNGLVAALEAHNRTSGTITSTTSGTLQDVPGLSVTLPGCVAGDLIEFAADAGYTSAAGGGGASTVTIVDGSAQQVSVKSLVAGTTNGTLVHVGGYTVVTGGNLVVKLQFNSSGGTTTSILGFANLLAKLHRP